MLMSASRQGSLGYLEKGIQTPMAQGRSTKIISMIKWIRTSRLSRNNSLTLSFVEQATEGEANGRLSSAADRLEQVCAIFHV